MVDGGRPLAKLMAIRARYPMVMHGVSLSIGSTDPLDMDYLARLKALAERVEPAIISDHLCWTGIAGLDMHDLLPLPLTEEVLAHVSIAHRSGTSVLGRTIALENASTYVTFAEDRSRSGSSWRRSPPHRLPAAARREQRLCQRPQSRFPRDCYIDAIRAMPSPISTSPGMSTTRPI